MGFRTKGRPTGLRPARTSGPPPLPSGRWQSPRGRTSRWPPGRLTLCCRLSVPGVLWKRPSLPSRWLVRRPAASGQDVPLGIDPGSSPLAAVLLDVPVVGVFAVGPVFDPDSPADVHEAEGHGTAGRQTRLFDLLGNFLERIFRHPRSVPRMGLSHAVGHLAS